MLHRFERWITSATGLGVLLLVFPFGPTGTHTAAAQPASDSARVSLLLEGARGTNVLMCELALHSVGGRYGNWGSAGRVPDATPGLADFAVWSATDIQSAGVVHMLSGALSDRDVCVPRLAARLFGYVTNPQGLDVLVELLRNGDGGTRQMAAIALGYLENIDGVDPLLDLLGDEAPAVRAAATWALGEIEDDRAIPELTRLLREDEDATVRRQAAWALGSMY